MAQSKLTILIEAKNQATGTINQVQAQVGGLERVVGGIGRVFGGLVAGYGAMQVGQMVWELGEAAAQSMRMQTSFEQLATAAGASSQEMLSAMRGASRGMIDDTSLMAAANRAMALGVGDSAGEMAQLLEVASARAKVMGLSVGQAFNDLVTGIGRASPEILDNLGIMTGGQATFAAYAASIGKAADQLTEAERKQALLNKVMAESESLIAANAGSALDAAGKLERLAASSTNARIALGTLFAPSIAAGADELASAANNAVEMFGSGDFFGTRNIIAAREAVDILTQEMRTLVGMQSEMEVGSQAWMAVGQRIAWVQAQLIQYQQQLNAATAATQVAAQETTNLNTALTYMTNADMMATQGTSSLGQAIYDMVTGIVQANSQLLALAGNVNAIGAIGDAASQRLRSNALGIAGTVGAEEAMRIYQAQNELLNRNVGAWKAMGLSEEEVLFRTAELEASLAGPVNQVRQMESDMRKVAPAVQEIDRAFEDLKGKVSGILSGGLNVGVGVNPEDFLPREDAINENARRLADIMVGGFKGQDWLGEFASEVPDIYAILQESGNPQEAAAQLLRDFQDGLRPELLDRERAKELVRRAILGEQNMAQLAQEIATELSQELGVSLSQAQEAAGSALGVGSALTEGVVSDRPGDKAITTLSTQLTEKSNLARVAQSGYAVAVAWGDAFVSRVGENVPGALIDILLMRILPALQASQAAQTGAEGAK